MIISWFSAGVSSAVATKLAISKYEDVKVIYIHIDDQHNDTMRFIKDCTKWFGTDIEVLQSHLKDVNTSCLNGFINSPRGALCTRLLKRRVRSEWELQFNTNFHYIWGFDYSEKERADRIVGNMPNNEHSFPLIEELIDKESAHGILKKEGIKRPVMYDLGYPNNNCIGCVKGGLGYWNKIKIDFPEIFESRCQLEEKVGGRVFRDFTLRELPEGKGRMQDIIVPDCGLFCDKIKE